MTQASFDIRFSMNVIQGVKTFDKKYGFFAEKETGITGRRSRESG